MFNSVTPWKTTLWRRKVSRVNWSRNDLVASGQAAEHSAENWTSMSTHPQGWRCIPEEWGKKAVRGGGWGGLLWKYDCWTWYGYSTCKLAMAVVTRIRPAGDWGSQHSIMVGGDHETLLITEGMLKQLMAAGVGGVISFGGVALSKLPML